MAKARKAESRELAELIDGLNEDLRHEYGAVITYRTYASAVRGPYRQELRQFFIKEIADELGHAGLICDKIVSLGGIPTTESAPVKYTEVEREMLENALQDEQDTIERYVKRRKHAEDLGEYGLAIDLDTLIADETNHRDELRLMLARASA